MLNLTEIEKEFIENFKNNIRFRENLKNCLIYGYVNHDNLRGYGSSNYVFTKTTTPELFDIIDKEKLKYAKEIAPTYWNEK